MKRWKCVTAVVIAFALGCIMLFAFQQDGGQLEVVWGKQWGTKGLEVITALILDSQGHIYIAGSTEGNLFGQNQGRWDIFVIKLDGNGQMLWSKQLGTPEEENGASIAVDGGGNIYVSTTTSGEWFGKNLGERDVILLKFSPDGQLLWGKRLGTGEEEFATDIAVDSQGYVYVSIWTTGRLFGRLKEEEDYEGVVIKVNPDGEVVWGKHLGYDTPDVIAIDSQGNVYLAGLSYDVTTNNVPTFVAKLAPDGTVIWRQVEQNTIDESTLINSFSLDRGVNLCFAGKVEVYVDENKLVGIPDALISKYNGANGQRVWSKRLISQGEEEIAEEFKDITIDGQGYVYVVGYAKGNLFGAHLGDADVVLGKFDAQGNMLWGKQWGTTKKEVGTAIAVDGQGNIFVAGDVEGDLYGTNAGQLDIFVAKFKQ